MAAGTRGSLLVTGSDGFIGSNFKVRAREAGWEVREFGRNGAIGDLPRLVAGAHAIVHLAGENRPADPLAFKEVNVDLTRTVCRAAAAADKPVPLLFSSSTQAELDNPYGRSKLEAESIIEEHAKQTRTPATIFRLPGVFGKWCRPDYNSVVATFCHNIANDLPIRISDSAKCVQLVYIDDVVTAFLDALGRTDGLHRGEVAPEYTISLGELAAQIKAFRNCRSDLVTERTGTGLTRALYATYVSYLPPAKAVYAIPGHSDPRGTFVEMLKTKDSGQFSYFTAHPGVTRGGHYHHTKTEKFLVLRGTARFRFRHILSGERFELQTEGTRPQVVETLPGWSHDITNVGTEEMIVMLWANEIFDRDRPDTVSSGV